MPKHEKRVCGHCGIEFGGHPSRVYCSEDCRKLGKEARLCPGVCAECGCGFRGVVNQLYCSVSCRIRRRNRKARERRSSLPRYGDEIASAFLEELSYDKESGLFFWRDGKAAGSVRDRRGKYLYIGLRGHLYQAANIAYLLVEGSWPPEGMVIDHINCNGLDNRWVNLRLVSPYQNALNREGIVGRYLPGVQKMTDKPRSKPYAARIGFTENGKHRRKSLGYFATAEEAGKAYLKAVAARL